MPELTPEQIKEEEHKRRKRAWNRIYWRCRKEREQTEQEAKDKELKKQSIIVKSCGKYRSFSLSQGTAFFKSHIIFFPKYSDVTNV